MNKPFIYIGILFGVLAICSLTLELSRDDNEASLGAKLSFAEFDDIILSPVNKITPLELASALMKQEQHYNLFDLRKGEVQYRIPTAEPLSAQQVIDRDIAVNEVIWLYSENESEALQLYYLLLIRGYFKVQVVAAGMNGWKQQILSPNVDSIADNMLLQRRAISEFFGGNFSKRQTDFSPKPIQLLKKHKKHHGC